MTLETSYRFTLPRGYLDQHGVLHREGTMRLATARDELEPLRDAMIDGPDDPRLTIVVLARVVERLGTLELVTTHEIESLFAADLAFLQDFYGVINFGSQQEYEELMAAQHELAAPLTAAAVRQPAVQQQGAEQPTPTTQPGGGGPAGAEHRAAARPTRAAIEEIRSDGR